MNESKLASMMSIMDNYENTIVVHNEFDDDFMRNEFERNLRDYAETMANEEGGKWLDFAKLVKKDEITWSDSGHNYKIYLQESTDIGLAKDLLSSMYSESLVLDGSEWGEEYMEKMLLDAAWKIYNNNLDLEEQMDFLKKELPKSIFGRISFRELSSFVKSLNNFDESQIRFWIKIK